jgi:glycogen(starch) synthase
MSSPAIGSGPRDAVKTPGNHPPVPQRPAGPLVKRVALFASAFHPHLGGVEELCRQLATEYQSRGVDVVVFTNRWPRSLPAGQVVDGTEVVRLPFRLPDGSLKSLVSYYLTHRRVRRETAAVLEDRRIDVIHVQCISASTSYAVAAARRLGLPLVVSTQGELTMDASGLFQRSPRMVEVFRDAVAAAAAFSACSADTLKEAQVHFGFRSGTVIYNGVRIHDFEGPVEPPGRPFVLAIGRHVRQKGFDVLLRAWSQAAIRSHELVLAGDGVEHHALRQLTADLKITDSIRFVGAADRRNAVRLFQSCSFFVLPSRIEPFGIVNLEAMAAGKAVVATRTGGVPELVEDGTTGLLVPPGDADALAVAIRTLAGNADLRLELGRAGRERAAAFDWSRIADQYMAVYAEVMRISGRPAAAGSITTQT